MRHLRVVIVAMVALAAIAGLGVGALVSTALSGDPYDPLGEFPIQRVESIVEGIEGPAVPLGEDVTITGTKCNNTDAAVKVTGSLFWQLIDPPGTTITVSVDVIGSLLPGCTVRTFENPMPQEVVLRSIAVKDRLGRDPIWHVTGKNTPISSDGVEGLPRAYESQNFTVVVP